MKKLMIMMLAMVPFGTFAQSAQDDYASVDNMFKTSYAYLGYNSIHNEMTSREDKKVSILPTDAIDEDMFKVDDLLLADPDFDIQENMISYTKDQKTVFFSAKRKIKLKKGNPENIKILKVVQLQLFKANVQENGEWVNLEMLPFNSKSHSTGHPALNQNDTKLYFVSDGPESTGKTDIFVVDLLEDGTYGKPENLGSEINSEEREVFPYVDESSVLYFESDIETGGNELNVFASKVIDNEPTTPVKLDVQANGSKMDYVVAYTEAMRLADEAANLRDLEILLEAESLAEITRIEEAFGDSMTGAAYDFSGDNVVYTVQIGAFKENVKTDTYNESSGLFNQRYDDGFNRFYSGVFETYEDAIAHLEQMKKDGYDDAFVLGLKGKNRFLPE